MQSLSLAVERAKISILEHPNQMALRSTLKGKKCRGFEPDVALDAHGDVADNPLERQLADEKISALSGDVGGLEELPAVGVIIDLLLRHTLVLSDVANGFSSGPPFLFLYAVDV